ncbi:MAG: 1-(5-phosphoribosyl)-5-[(5-phosphoribosylamino)methylideneamino]imidazole-4-carboxamide isomerase [Minicystis sp.]
MHVLPAIDLLDGKAVRLHQGRYDAVTVYSDDPAAFAASFRGKVPILHVVDLAGARAGHAVERDLVRAIVAEFSAGGGGVQVGGGIRSIEAAEGYLDLGAARVVLGTAAVKDPALVRAAATRFPDRIVIALDAKDGKVALDGWEQLSTRTALEVARDLAGLPIAAILYTDVARDGTQVGPNLAATAELAAAASCPVLASGGVGTLDHLRALAKIANVTGAVVGRALYEKAFTLDEAITAARG